MTTKDAPLQFKGTTLKIIQIQLRTADLGVLHATLADLTGNAPDFFDNDLAVLDFSDAADLPATVDWHALGDLLRLSSLHAIATRGLPDALAAEAARSGLPAIAADALSNKPSRPRPAEPVLVANEEAASTAAGGAATTESPPVATHAPAETAARQPVQGDLPLEPAVEPTPQTASARNEPVARTVTLDKPLRSGQRFYARGADLIVTAMVSAGAEVIADGHIHVYAPLRGRALAGASGDASARIFTTSLEAELVSVAGFYRTFEAGVPPELARQPATIALIGEGEAQRLNVGPLALR